jgi:SAM-dependent methyltransferase
MNSMKDFFSKILVTILAFLTLVPSKIIYIMSKVIGYIYDVCLTLPVTTTIYKHLATIINQYFGNKAVAMIDIGCASGKPLKSIINDCNFSRIQAIDINKHYLLVAKNRFKDQQNIDVKYQNFLEMPEVHEKDKFDVVFFGMSLMLMEDKAKALQIALRILKPGGKIFTFLTLYHKKNRFIEFMKPKMKYWTSIDMGECLYYDDFKDIISQGDCRVVKEERLNHTFFLRLLTPYLYFYEIEGIKSQ